MRLTDDELRDVLARAEEIQRGSLQGGHWTAELAAVIGAAEEVGLSRQAVERALSERFNIALTPPDVGALTWAKTADGKYYVAEVVSTSDNVVRVRFLGGSEHTTTLDQLRVSAFMPGEKVMCTWPWWGPWKCTVVAYDPAMRRVKLSDGWGSVKTFPISEIWLPPTRPKVNMTRARLYAAVAGAGAGVGALIGSLITALLLR
jgi:hypothetical protein